MRLKIGSSEKQTFLAGLEHGRNTGDGRCLASSMPQLDPGLRKGDKAPPAFLSFFRAGAVFMSRHKPLVFSGVQPTGNLHLGNYLGAIRNFVRLQQSYSCLYCVVDMHAITIWQEPQELRNATREVASAFIAAGVDPKAHIIFNQSQVAAHAELAWIFNCVARIGWLNRMTQFKDKAGSNREKASVGLYAYPNLMAADILAYRATHVPIGEDQTQHLELARDIAQKFNTDFGVPDFFPQPEALLQPEGARIMSLKDGTKKMSKSDPSDLSRINLNDDADAIAKKIRKARTDPEPLPATGKELESRPEARNLVGIYAALSDTSAQEVLQEFAGSEFSRFKGRLTDLCVAKLGPIGAEMKRLMADPAYVEGVLADGAARAHAIAAPIMTEVYDVVGFIRAR
jgi:tryptophanyl-tRNA synthetase